MYWTYQHHVERIEARWLGEISDDWISKRKWQHWRTFNKWCDRRESFIEKSEQAVVGALFNLVKPELNGKGEVKRFTGEIET